MTALYDAIGQTVRSTQKEVKDNDEVLVVIMTDGHENMSMEFDQQAIFKLISDLEENANWTFVYLGADQDSFGIGASMGIKSGNTMNYRATGQSHSSAVQNLTTATLARKRSVDTKTSSFYGDAGIDNTKIAGEDDSGST